MIQPKNLDFASALRRYSGGVEGEIDSLISSVYDDLRLIANSMLRWQNGGYTLQPTALVHEAYIKLLAQREATYNDAAHFRAVAAMTLRRVLIDYLRKKGSIKRGGGHARVTLNCVAGDSHEPLLVDLLDLDDALVELTKLNPRQAKTIELQYFGGLSVEDTAEVLGVSPRMVDKIRRFANIWLRLRLGGSHDS